MNYSAYLFGDLGLGYTQYPDDFTKEIYQRIVSSSNVNTQIAIYRDSNLVYYVYHRRLSPVNGNENYIGIAISFNDVYYNDIKQFFSVFEDTITNLVVAGKILEFTDDGDISVNNVKLFQIKNEIDRITAALSLSIDKIPYKSFVKLPAINYGISKNEKIKLPASVTPSEIDSNIRQYNQLYIFKNEDFDSQELSGYAGKIRAFNQQIKKLTQDNSSLLSELEKIKKQKKQYRLVLVLAFILMGCIVGLIAFNNNVENLKSEVADKTSTISTLRGDINEKENTISNLNSTVSKQKKEISELNSTIETLEEDKENLKNSLAQLPPILITDLKMGVVNNDGDIVVEYGNTIYSSNTMYLSPKITYYGIKSESIVLKTKLFLPNGSLSYNSEVSPSGFTNKTDMYASEGRNDRCLTGWGANRKGNWASGDYRIEIWYNSTCLYSKVFKIY